MPWHRWFLGQLDWPATADVLEVGCGPGWMWVEGADLVPEGLRLTLTDLSPGMVEAARHRLVDLDRFAAVEARTADVGALPYGDASFDVVVASHVLHHAPSPSRAVREIARVLRPGGVLFAAAAGPRNLEQLWQIEAEVFGPGAVRTLVRRFGRVSGRPLLEEAFAGVEWRGYDDELHCTDADDVIAFITSALPGEAATPDQLRHVRRIVARRFDEGGGTFVIAKETGAFIARPPLSR